MSHTLLYLTGVGGQKTTDRQRRYVNWRGQKRGWNVVFFDSMWESKEPLAEKLSRLDEEVAPLDSSSTTVLAISAGATELVYLFNKYPSLQRGISFAGAPTGSKTIGETYRQRAVALYGAQVLSESIIARDPAQFAGKVTVHRPLYDEVVDRSNMPIGDASLRVIPSIGHVLSITHALIFRFPKPNQ